MPRRLGCHALCLLVKLPMQVCAVCRQVRFMAWGLMVWVQVDKCCLDLALTNPVNHHRPGTRRFVLQHPLVTSAVIGASGPEQLQKLLGIAERCEPLGADIMRAVNEMHGTLPNPTP